MLEQLHANMDGGYYITVKCTCKFHDICVYVCVVALTAPMRDTLKELERMLQ